VGRRRPVAGGRAAAPLTAKMLLLITSIKLLAEIAVLALLGQWVLGALVGAQRQRNGVYQLLAVLTRPLHQGVRRCLAPTATDRRVGRWVLLLLCSVWLVATVAKVRYCLLIGVALCR
jgi:hypothetical protein